MTAESAGTSVPIGVVFISENDTCTYIAVTIVGPTYTSEQIVHQVTVYDDYLPGTHYTKNCPKKGVPFSSTMDSTHKNVGGFYCPTPQQDCSTRRTAGKKHT